MRRYDRSREKENEAHQEEEQGRHGKEPEIVWPQTEHRPSETAYQFNELTETSSHKVDGGWG